MMERKVSNGYVGQSMFPKQETEEEVMSIMPVSKRIFDLVVAFILLDLLSLILILAAIAIRLESPGKVYSSMVRVGRYGKKFNLYRFRSLRTGANADINKEIPISGVISKDPYVTNDLRVTIVGKIIRNTGIEKWPQLINVIKGDMSIVGNDPLPEYEAHRLTTDENWKRFLAPAGIISLWQVEERRSGRFMSENERISLDNAYADQFIRGKYSIWYDLALIFRRII